MKLERPKRADDFVISLGPLEKLRERVVVPPATLVAQRAAVYAFLVAWGLYAAAATGPAFQLAVGFAYTAYVVFEKRPAKALFPALGQALAGLLAGWLLGSVVPVYVPLFPPAMAPETVASLFAFATMFVAAVFFK